MIQQLARQATCFVLGPVTSECTRCVYLESTSIRKSSRSRVGTKRLKPNWLYVGHVTQTQRTPTCIVRNNSKNKRGSCGHQKGLFSVEHHLHEPAKQRARYYRLLMVTPWSHRRHPHAHINTFRHLNLQRRTEFENTQANGSKKRGRQTQT